MSYLDEAAAEVRAMLEANARREQFAIDHGENRHSPVRAGIRAERLLIIDRLTAIAAIERGAPEAPAPPWCWRCGGPACDGPAPDEEAAPCDGDLPAEEE